MIIRRVRRPMPGFIGHGASFALIAGDGADSSRNAMPVRAPRCLLDGGAHTPNPALHRPAPAVPSPAQPRLLHTVAHSTLRYGLGTGRDGIRRCRGTTRAGRSGGSVGRRVHAVHDEWLHRGSQLKGTALGVRGRGMPMAGERQVARGRRGTEEGQNCVLRPGNAECLASQKQTPECVASACGAAARRGDAEAEDPRVHDSRSA